MEPTLRNTIEDFITALEHVERHKPGASLTLSLSVESPSKYDDEKQPKIRLSANFYDGSQHNTVTAASLDALMGEVGRRLGFADREALRVDELQRSFRALPKPEGDDENR